MVKEKIPAGKKVKIRKLSRASYFLFKDFEKKSPIIVCPCHLKHEVLEVVEHFDNDTILCKYKDRLTILYATDINVL